MLTGIVLAAATLAGQCPPGVICIPSPAIRVEPTVVMPNGVEPARAWHWAIVQGQRTQIWGYKLANGNIAWNVHEQPPEGPPKPETKEPEKTGAIQDFGMVASKLTKQKEPLIIASDESTRQDAIEAVKNHLGANQGEAEGDEEKRPLNPVRRVEQDITAMVAYGAAGVLALAGVLLLASRRNS